MLFECFKTKIAACQVVRKSSLLLSCMVAAWLSGSALVLINGVTLRRARLILGWVTVYK